MAYIPDIIDYRPFYIQTDADEFAIDTTAFGMVAKSTPYPVLPNPKEPYKNSWLDENGDDEYNDQMFYEPYEFDVSFYVKTLGSDAEKTMISQLESFFSKVRNGEFKIYDAHTGIGRQKVRYAGYVEENKKVTSSWARLIFTIKFKVNDPIGRVTLSNGKLIMV